MDTNKLKGILNKHIKWIKGEDGGERADLRNADLSGADLRSANLSGADLSGADLSVADLRNADLSGADLSGADLRSADLRNADLSGADLSGADLSGADLSGADLRSADLRNADLRSANLSGADLRSADLRSADLRSADLRSANLRNADLRSADLRSADLRSADLRNAKNVSYVPMLLPEGEFIAWKKLKGYIVKLKVLEDSKRSRATSEKCRCDKALVLDIQNLDGSPSGIKSLINRDYAECEYKVGEVVHADKWDEDRWKECSHGIHFFIDRQTAINY